MRQRLSDIDWFTQKISAGDHKVEIGLEKILAELPADATFADKFHALQSNTTLWPDYLPRSFSAEYAQQWILHWRTTGSALWDYHFQPIPIKIHLFTAQGHPEFKDEELLKWATDPFRGWDKLLDPNQIHATPVPGLHSQLMSPPYVETVGDAISSALKFASRGHGCPAAPTFAPLIPIQTGRRRMAPVICIPGAGGNVASFVDLVAALGDDYTVHGLQPRGFADGEVPHSNVAAMAATYVRAIALEYPAGPVHLLGHSFGGCVVFEMAQQLRSIGRTPTSLTVVDGDLPEIDATREFSDIDSFLKLIELFEMNSGCSLGIQTDDLAVLSPDERLALLHASLVRAGMAPGNLLVKSLGRIFRTFSSHLRTSYAPYQTFDGAFNLVLLPDKRLGDGEASVRMYEKEQRWRRWAPRLEVWHGPGNHMTILRQPHVAALADWLRRKYCVD